MESGDRACALKLECWVEDASAAGGQSQQPLAFCEIAHTLPSSNGAENLCDIGPAIHRPEMPVPHDLRRSKEGGTTSELFLLCRVGELRQLQSREGVRESLGGCSVRSHAPRLVCQDRQVKAVKILAVRLPSRARGLRRAGPVILASGLRR